MRRPRDVAKTNGKKPSAKRLYLRPHPGETPEQFAERAYATLWELIDRDKAAAPEKE